MEVSGFLVVGFFECGELVLLENAHALGRVALKSTEM
jgi:hypothetical protein